MKTFLVFYLFLLIAGTAAIDLLVNIPVNAAETPGETGGETTAPGAEGIPRPAEAPGAEREETPRPVDTAADTRRDLPPLPGNLKSSGSFQAWGVAETRLATSAGELQGGTFLEFADINAEPLNAWFFANQKWNGPVEVPAGKVIFFGGVLDDAEPSDLRLLQRYYFLRGQLDAPPAPVAALPAPVPPANPFEAEYKAIVKKYLEFQERTKTLTAQRDAARGAARNKISDELREMTYQEPALVRELKAVQSKYNDWKTSHPAPVAQPAPAETPDPARDAGFRDELRRLEPDVRRIVGQPIPHPPGT